MAIGGWDDRWGILPAREGKEACGDGSGRWEDGCGRSGREAGGQAAEGIAHR